MALCSGGEGSSPPDEEGFRYACKFEDLVEGKGTKVMLGSKALALFLTKGTVVVQGQDVFAVCPGHGYHFNCKSGFSKESSGSFKQKTYTVKKKGSEVWVK